MPEWLTGAFDWLVAAPEIVFLSALGLAAGLENVVPPIPADVVVLAGSVLAVHAGAHLGTVFLAVWLGNVGGALLVYLLGRRYGLGFFEGRIGRWLLRPAQLAALGTVYRRYGFIVIFVSRFLPMFRAVVPVFAGVSRLGFWRTAVPLASASALWYGALVYLGGTAGRSWEALVGGLESTGRWLAGAALVLALAVIWWWRRSR